MKYAILRDAITGRHYLRFSDAPLESHLEEVGAEYDLKTARRRVDLLNRPELSPLAPKLVCRSWWEKPRPWWEEQQPPKEKNP